MSRRPLADRGYAPDDPLAALLAADEVAVPRPGLKETLRSDLMSRPPVAAGPTPLRRIGDLPAPLLGAAVVVLLLGALAGLMLVGDGSWSKQGVEPEERAADTAPTALDSVAPEEGSTPAAPGDEGDRSPAASRADHAGDETGSEDDGERAPASAAGESDGPAASAAEGDGGSGAGDASGEPAAAGAAGAQQTSTVAAASDPDGSGAGLPVRTAPPQATSEPEKPRPEPTSTRVVPAATSEPPTDEPTDAPTDEPTEDPGGFPPPPTAAPTGKPWPTETPPPEPPGPSP